MIAGMLPVVGILVGMVIVLALASQIRPSLAGRGSTFRK